MIYFYIMIKICTKKQSKSAHPIGKKLNVGTPPQEYEPKNQSGHTIAPEIEKYWFMFSPQVKFPA